MDYTKLIQSYYYDLNNLTDLLTKLAGTYKLLVSSAEELNRIALAKRNDVEDAIDRAEDIGKVIKRIIDVLEVETNVYISYARTKNEFISGNFSFDEIIRTEIENHLRVEENGS